jgi:hypothetical protein
MKAKKGRQPDSRKQAHKPPLRPSDEDHRRRFSDLLDDAIFGPPKKAKKTR